jgi:hypothetical protein
MRKTTFMLTVTAMMATSVAAFGQVIPANTTFFDYDFTATDQITAEVDGTGAFTGTDNNRGPFEDRTLSGNTSLDPQVFGQVGFESSNNGMNKYGTYLDVDTTNGYAQETSDVSFYQNTNIFTGQPKISVGDTVRLISELSFDKPSIEDAMNPGTFVEGNSQDSNFFFGFRSGGGGGEFQPNNGVAQAFRFNLGTDNVDPADSTIQAFTLSAPLSPELLIPGNDGFVNGEIAFAPATDLGLGVPANGTDLNPSDVFRIVTDVTYTSSDGTDSTFTAETKIETLDGTQLGATVTTTLIDDAILLAGDRIQFAIRDGASANVGNPQNTRIHRLAAIFNPEDSAAPLKGDADLSGIVDFSDIPAFITVLQSGVYQAEADCDCSGVVDFSDIPAFILILQAG